MWSTHIWGHLQLRFVCQWWWKTVVDGAEGRRGERLPVRRPLVSVAAAVGAAAAAAGSGGGPTGGPRAAALPMQGGASWDWTPAGTPLLNPAGGVTGRTISSNFHKKKKMNKKKHLIRATINTINDMPQRKSSHQNANQNLKCRNAD